MSVKRKLIVVLPLVLLAGAGAGYKFILAPKPAAAPKPKIDGEIVSLEPELVLNLKGGRYGRVTVALVVEHGALGAAEGAEGAALPQDAAIRALITDRLTGLPARDLLIRKRRNEIVAQLVDELHAKTDEPVEDVLITDLAIQ